MRQFLNANQRGIHKHMKRHTTRKAPQGNKCPSWMYEKGTLDSLAFTHNEERQLSIFRNCTAGQIIAKALRAGSPTEGVFAAALWRYCLNIYDLDKAAAFELYKKCGYKPFQGYPLETFRLYQDLSA